MMSSQSVGAVAMSKREMKKSYNLLVRSLLTDTEKEFLYQIAKKYQRSRHIDIFFQELSQIINTQGKLRLLPYIRTVIFEYDKHDFDKFANQLEHRMKEAKTEFKMKPKNTQYTLAPPVRSSVPNGRSDLRVIVIPHREDNLGFSIRGGSEHGLGIFVSEVDEGSSAGDAGLEVGDQILEANNISLENAACSSAVRVLTVTDRLKLIVKRVGKIPEWKLAKEKVLWCDVPSGEIVAASPVDPDTYHISGLDRQAIQEKRVAIKTSTNTDFIGLNIRGGSEYGLGIYISRVDPGGLAEKNGICTGDQVIDVNGTDFTKISHSAAADFLRTNSRLVFTLREVGRYPAFKELFAEYTWSETANRKSAKLPVAESPISSPKSTLHRQTHNPDKASQIPKAKSLSNLSMGSGSGLVSEIYLPKQSNSNLDIVYHGKEQESWKTMDFFDLTGKSHRSSHDLTRTRDVKDDLEFSDSNFICLNGDGELSETVNDTDSGKLKKHHERKIFPSTSKAVLANRLRTHYETKDSGKTRADVNTRADVYHKIEQNGHRDTSPRTTRADVVHRNPNPSSSHYEIVDIDIENGGLKPINFEEYIIPKEKLPESEPYTSVKIQPQSHTEHFALSKAERLHHQPNGFDEVDTLDTVIVTEVEEQQRSEEEPIYTKVNKVKAQDTRTQELREVNRGSKGEITDGSMTPEEEEVLQNLDDQIKMLEDRKSHLSSRAVTQISPTEGREKKGTWSKIKSRLRSSIRLKKKKVQESPDITSQPPSHILLNQGSIDKDKMPMLEERARTILSDREYAEVMSLVESYHESKDLDLLVNPLLKLLDKPDKMLLLRDIRGVVYPYHTARYDNMLNYYEIEKYEEMSTKLHLPLRHSEKVEIRPKQQLMTTVLDENGHFHIRTVNQHAKDLQVKKNVLQKLKSQSSQEGHTPDPPKPVKSTDPPKPVKSLDPPKPMKPPSIDQIQWVKLNHVQDQANRPTIHQIFNNKDDIPDPNSTFVFIPKQKQQLGLLLRGGRVGKVKLPIRIDEILPDGAAASSILLQPGMILTSIDGETVVGCTHDEAQALLVKSFNNNKEAAMKLQVKL